jgi:predicted ribosome quality control (RQC) complex YloA/Tae2 family protein
MELRRQEPESNFRRFLIDNKYHLFVGKNSKNNEELTTKFAKQNDLWFHARSVSGSHVVLRIENIKEQVPKNIIKKAASIAAFYSKAKTSKLVSVSYTFKKYVIKKKNLDPGQVILLREQVILVPPEIPEGCNPVE